MLICKTSVSVKWWGGALVTDWQEIASAFTSMENLGKYVWVNIANSEYLMTMQQVPKNNGPTLSQLAENSNAGHNHTVSNNYIQRDFKMRVEGLNPLITQVCLVLQKP